MAGIGEALRSTRERRGLSIDEVARDTRISPRFLEALESEQFEELPAPVYVRGFIRSYAGYLKLEPQPLLDQLVGGGTGSTGSTAGYVGGNHKPGANSDTRRRSDPFQRSGVVAVPPARVDSVKVETAAAAPQADADAWSPEPPAPFSAEPVSHAYIPGSDLMEAPEYPELQEYPEAEPVFRPRTPGVLAERPPSPGDPGVPRKVAVLGGAVFALLGMLLLAVFLTRGNDDGTTTNAAATNPTVELTPGSVIALTTRTPSPAASASPSASPSATVSTSPSATVSTTVTPGTATPVPTQGPTTPTPTATPAESVTSVPTAAPTVKLPTAAPTVGAPPHPSTISACDTSKASEKCGSAYARVICYPPFAQTDPTGKNNNYFVDVTGEYPLQPGWRETTIYAPTSIGPVLEAGRNSCL